MTACLTNSCVKDDLRWLDMDVTPDRSCLLRPKKLLGVFQVIGSHIEKGCNPEFFFALQIKKYKKNEKTYCHTKESTNKYIKQIATRATYFSKWLPETYIIF